ncbi:SDR family oxidoreductase [Pseudarthrobacter sp. N5]|uniref:SDR family oxidoreductase n=1 Tax=Pseudarthrobacter sp. N5 TaxID=3418416 RepID=UPI003CE86C28
MILVAGGTGRLGTVLLRKIAERKIADGGTPVRVLTRSEASAGRLRDEGLECVVGDLRNPADAVRAVQGCSTVISAVSGFGPMGKSTPENVDRDGNIRLIEASVRAGVKHFVMVSMHGAGQDSAIPLLRMKHLAEQALKASGLSWTIVRPTPCLETYLDVMGAPLAKKGTTVMFGSGASTINFVSVSDVAEVVLRALDDPALRGEAIELGGPNLTLGQLSAALHAAAGTKGKTNRIPLPALRIISMAARPFSPFMARAAQAAVVMNTTDMAFDAGPSRLRFPGLPLTSLAEATARLR